LCSTLKAIINPPLAKWELVQWWELNIQELWLKFDIDGHFVCGLWSCGNFTFTVLSHSENVFHTFKPICESYAGNSG
jgi:hypothetical protein